jgi:glycosyltransferase involved in cell wall biosynthesis
MIRVLIDGRISGPDGIGRYTACLTKAMAALAGPEVRIIVLGPTGMPRYSLAEGAELVRAAIGARADLIHALDFRIPVEPLPIPVIATVHDVLRLDHRHCYADHQFTRQFGSDRLARLRAAVMSLREPPRRGGPLAGTAGISLHAEFYVRMLEWTCQQARHIVTPTATVAAQLAERIPLSGRPVPIPLGIDHLAISAADDAGTVPGVEAPRFLLYVGQARAHKGLPGLIAAYQRSRAIASGVPLVCVGRDFAPGTDATAQLEDALGHHAIALGEVPDSVLRTVYMRAAALVHLSMHEGFGLTPLEAMACGSRVIASDIPVLRETLGPHAGLVEPGSTADVARAIDKILAEPDDGQARDSRMRWAGRHTWYQCAKRILRLYRECQNS